MCMHFVAAAALLCSAAAAAAAATDFLVLLRRVVRCYCDASSGHCGVDFERGGQRQRPVVSVAVVASLILCVR